jgi:hypothetical protein
MSDSPQGGGARWIARVAEGDPEVVRCEVQRLWAAVVEAKLCRHLPFGVGHADHIDLHAGEALRHHIRCGKRRWQGNRLSQLPIARKLLLRRVGSGHQGADGSRQSIGIRLPDQQIRGSSNHLKRAETSGHNPNARAWSRSDFALIYMAQAERIFLNLTGP